MRAIENTIGRIRLARGRCPICASDPGEARACGSCHGYQGPFPVSEETSRRWLARFARSRAIATVVTVPEQPIAVWSPIH